MNLMERHLQPVRLAPADAGARDADAAPAAPAQTTLIRALLTPYEETVKEAPFGLVKKRGYQLLYDGTARLEAGMRATVRPGETDEADYRVEHVRRYPWLQAAELRPLAAEAGL